MMRLVRNPSLAGFECIRCGARRPLADYPMGCPGCLARGDPANVFPHYGDIPTSPTGIKTDQPARRLPYHSGPSLGEGNTPVIALTRLAGALGLDALFVKAEFANPTGSHKDRMSAQFIARALDNGASTVTCASSGNAGASLASYAAFVGLRCVVASTPMMSSGWRKAIAKTGAEIVALPDALARWRFVSQKVREEGWFSATNFLEPPVGSEPFGVDGYKTLGYELAEDLQTADIDAILVPTARGDLLWGIYRGLEERRETGRLTRLPLLVAVEPFPRLEKVLAGSDHRFSYPGQTSLSSIAGTTVTYQALAALQRTGGIAVSVTDEAASADQKALAKSGLFLELSAAAALSGLRLLLERGASGIKRAVLIATSHGYKE